MFIGFWHSVAMNFQTDQIDTGAEQVRSARAGLISSLFGLFSRGRSLGGFIEGLAGIFQAAVAYSGAKEAQSRADHQDQNKRRAGQAIPQEP